MGRTSPLFRAASFAALLAAFAAVTAPTLTKILFGAGAINSPEGVLVCGADGQTVRSVKELGSVALPTPHPPADRSGAQGHGNDCPYCGLAFLTVAADLHLRFEAPRADAFVLHFRASPAPEKGWMLLPSRAPPVVV